MLGFLIFVSFADFLSFMSKKEKKSLFYKILKFFDLIGKAIFRISFFFVTYFERKMAKDMFLWFS